MTYLYIPYKFRIYDTVAYNLGYKWKSGIIFSGENIDTTQLFTKIPLYYLDEIQISIVDGVEEYQNVSLKSKLSPKVFEVLTSGILQIVVFLDDSYIPYTISSISGDVMVPMGYYDCSITLQPFKCFKVGDEIELISTSSFENDILFVPYPYTSGFKLVATDGNLIEQGLE